MNRFIKPVLTSFLLLSVPCFTTADELLTRGKYLVQISGCNDCHTPNYPETAGEIPIEQWLTGNEVGFQGPWGTTYPINLRLYVQDYHRGPMARSGTPPHAPAHALV